jgi:hypothetical protein
MDPEEMIEEMVQYGIGGIEVYYPYRIQDLGIAEETLRRFTRRLRGLCDRYQLIATRGSDSHTVLEMEKNWTGN